MELGALAISLLATLLAFALGLLGSIYLARAQMREELARARDAYRREREDRELEYRRERADRDAECRQERADREAEYARQRREQENELIDALVAEVSHNILVCSEAFDGLRYGTTQHSAMASSLGIRLSERARQSIRRAYAFGSVYDDFVRAMPTDARMLRETYQRSAAGQISAAAREYARTAHGHFEDAGQKLAEVVEERSRPTRASPGL